MPRKNLYHIQDDDRPMWVLANSWSDALAKWKTVVAAENDMKAEEVSEPNGIAIVCESDDVIE